MKIGAVVLAAGGSTRLGTPKQLLVYRGKTLLRRAAEAALEAGVEPVVVILGARADALGEQLTGLPVRIVHNPGWAAGQGTSVRLGVAALAEDDCAGALLSLCDQPLVTGAMLRSLVAALQANGPGGIVAAAYNGTLGVPAGFGRDHFAELLDLPDDAGAKPILRRHAAAIIPIPIPEAAVDIDTREQFERLQLS